MRHFTWAALVLAAAYGAGCGGGTGDGDAGGIDAPRLPDADIALDTAPGDGGAPDDVPATPDAPVDDDAPSEPDGGTSEEDACVPPVCPAPPPGCNYVGGSLCECGTLECDTGSCAERCGPGQFCDLCAEVPMCEVRPVTEPGICPAVYMPVCGCDGITYSNACELRHAMIEMLHDGECGGGVSDTCDPPCRAGTTCMPCRGIGGLVYSCIPDGASC